MSRGIPKPPIAVRYTCTTHGPQTPKRIVIHSTECGDQRGIVDILGIAAFWQRQGQGLGAHFIIDGEGLIGQGAKGGSITWAVAGHNTGCIHIELVGYAKFTPRTWFLRRAQLRSLVRLLAFLTDRWNIPLTHSTNEGICRHADFHGDHTDPGKGFPFNRVIERTRKLVAAHGTPRR